MHILLLILKIIGILLLILLGLLLLFVLAVLFAPVRYRADGTLLELKKRPVCPVTDRRKKHRQNKKEQKSEKDQKQDPDDL